MCGRGGGGGRGRCVCCGVDVCAAGVRGAGEV